MMSTDDIVRALGGRHAIAARCQVTPQAVGNWRRDGIPYRHFDTLRSMADEAGVELTFEAMRAARPDRGFTTPPQLRAEVIGA